MGGSVTFAQDVWTFTDTSVWGNMTGKGKSDNYKEIATGSEVWFAADGSAATSETSNVSFKFESDQARFNYGGIHGLGYNKNYDSENDINYLKVVLPDGYRATIAITCGSAGRPVVVNRGGTTQNFTANGTYDYTNETGSAETLKIYGTNVGGKAYQTNAVTSVTLIDTKAVASHSWSANAVATIGGTPTTIKTYSSKADVMEGVDYTITVDKAIIYNEKCYVLNDAAFSANIYSKTYTMGTSAGSHTFNYEEVENFAFYGEAENIVSASSNGATEEGTFFSNGKGYRAQGTSGYVTLAFHVAEDGLYHIVLGMNNNNNRERGYNYAINDDEVSGTYAVSANTPSVLEVDHCLESGDHTITMNITYSRTPCFDYLLITKVGPASVSKTITPAGWATYCSPYALDFTSAIANLSAAYLVIGGDGDYVTKSQITTTIPANTGILLRGEGVVTIPVVASSSTDVSANKLIGKTAEYALAAGAGYVLMNDDIYGVGFYQNVNAFTVGANTAYLSSNFAGGSARSFFGLWNDGETTGIADVRSKMSDVRGDFFDLSGRKVAQPTKGLYIVNGKKVVIK